MYIYVYTHTTYIYVYIRIYICIHTHIFFIHSPVDGHLGCFHILTVVNHVSSIFLTVPYKWMCCSITS